MFELPKLEYSYDALEPFIDAKTMETHYSKHHQTYVNNLNDILAKHPELTFSKVEDILMNLNKIPEDIRTSIKNNAGGVFNHSLFWLLLSPQTDQEPMGKLKEAIDKTFTNYANFKEMFTKTALSRFGSGWAWLVENDQKDLEIYSTANQDSPISENKRPIMCLDVWEHAYYLKYQNRRAEYIENWWHLANWDKASQLY